MGGVGELLELLHGAASRWTTVRLTVRRWSDDELTSRAMRRAADLRSARGHSVVTSSRGHGAPGTWEWTTRAWIDRAHDRLKTDADGPHGRHLTVEVGPTWWVWTPVTGAISNEGQPETGGPGASEVDWMLDPSSLIPAFDFTVVGSVEVAGRPAVQAVAVPRPHDDRLGFAAFLAGGADDVSLAVDGQRGTVLLAEFRIDGRPYNRYEVTEVAFDEAFDDEVFRFVPPNGLPVRSPRETFAQPEPVSVETAARRASFTVLAPTRLPRGWSVDAAYSPAGTRPPRPDSVSLHVRDERGMAARIRIQQYGEAVPDQVGWEAVEYQGMRILLFRHAGPMGNYEAKAEIDGTHVRASGNVDREALLQIVASLRPAPTELPPFG